MKRVKKLVSQISLLGLGFAMLLANVGFAASTKKTNQAKLTSTSTQKVRLNSKGLKVLSTKRNTGTQASSYQAPVLLAANTNYKKKSLLQQNAMTSDQAVSDGKIISGSVSLSQSRSLIDYQDGTLSESQSAAIGLRGRLSNNWTVSGSASLNQDTRDSESLGNGASDTSISFSRKSTKLTTNLTSGYSFSTLLPTSKYSSQYQNLQGTLGASYRIGFAEDVLMDGLDISFALGATRLFHQFDTDKSGAVLNQYSVRESVSASYSYKKFSFSLDANHRHAWTYQGRVKQAYEISEEISYSVLPNWGVSLGHTNSEAWLKPNGQDSNFKLINENNSIVYISTSVLF